MDYSITEIEFERVNQYFSITFVVLENGRKVLEVLEFYTNLPV